MNRRKYLTAVAGMGAISLAGCSALSDDTEELERQLREKNQTIDDLEREIEDTEQDVSELEEQREALIIERVTLLYERAEVFFSRGEEAYSNGITAIEQETTEQDTRALNQFRAAWGSYDAATDLTFEARTLANDEGYSNAADLASDANLYVSNMRDACDSYAVAAQNFLIDNIEAGNQRASAGNTAHDEAQQYTFASLTVFESSISS